MMFLLLFLIFAIVAAAIWFQGLWSAAVTLVNLFLAMMIATTFWEPVTTMLEGAGASSYSYLLDFLILWILFAFAFGILRAVTDILSPTKVTFDMPVEMAGRSLLALWCAWLVVCFTAFSLQMAPLNSPTPLGAWSTPTSPTFLVTSPDRLWLGFVHSRSKGAFSNGQVFDPAAEFALKYRDRRIKYAQASDMRVAQ
jgi:hypothetical protein